MSKRHFIALADLLRSHDFKMSISLIDDPAKRYQAIANMLADFCRSQNPAFNRERWLGYINGDNGPSGGKR